MNTLLQDLRYAIRQLLRTPGFTAVAVLTLALGIGANTAMFGVLDALFLRPPAGVRQPEQVKRIYIVRNEGSPQTGEEGGAGSYPDYHDLRTEATAFSSVAGQLPPQDIDLGRGESAQQVKGLQVTGSYFPTLGTRPALGRFFGPAEDSIPGASPVTVLSYGFWQRQFGGDSAVIGRQIRLEGKMFTVIGVAAEGFHGIDAEKVDLWTPTAMSSWDGFMKMHNFIGLYLFGRIAPGVTPERAAAEAITVLTRHAHDSDGAQYVNTLDPTPSAFLGPVNSALGPKRSEPATIALWLALVTGIVLLIACANVANLLLARATRRRREIGVRIALGAGRARLVRQLLTESIVLALLGGAVGLLLALWSSALIRFFPLPPLPSVIDGRMLGFTLAVSLLTGILFGLLPAMQASRLKLMPSLRDGGERGGLSRSRTRVALLVVQVALSLVLLVGAGLMVRSLLAGQSIHTGIDADHLLYASVNLSEEGYDGAASTALYDRMEERLRALPGVERVSSSIFPPLSGFGMTRGPFILPGRDPQPKAAEGPYTNPVGADYFPTLGIPVLEGRGFNTAERSGDAQVLIVNETMAHLFWPNGDALGACVQMQYPNGNEPPPCVEVVGIVGDVRHDLLREPVPEYYIPQGKPGPSQRTLLVRTKGDPEAMIEPIRSAIQGLAPDLPFVSVTRATEAFAQPLLPYRLGAILFSLFGLLALLLAAIGLYGVMAFTVAQQTREIGVRMALGAEQGNVLRMVILRAMGLALLGVGVGVVGALIVTRFMKGLLYGVGTLDPLTFVAVPLVLLAVAMLASWIPARRATRVDPVVALRAE